MFINPNAIAVLEKRYLVKDEQGQPVEDVEGLFRRVADAIAAPDATYDDKADLTALSDKFFELMTGLDFLPNSPTLMNAGRHLGQLSACFVLPVADTMEGIFDSIKNAALIHKSGGGTGFSFSRLRSKGATVNSTGGVASGPVSFMKVFNAATEAVKQGGTRRGANMGILRVDHPDILEFIACKNVTTEINNFNISVGLTEDFMFAAEKGENYCLLDPATGEVRGELNAKEVLETIITSAWKTGEPGIIFLDRLNRDNIVPSQGPIESTNPCGEQPLLPYESCNLGSINLVTHIKETAHGYEIDWEKLKETIYTSVHFLDNVIDANKYPLVEIDKTTKLTRKIGLGVMGFADMLLYIGVPYNSDEGVAIARKIMKFVTEQGHAASIELAKVRGAFPLFEDSILKDGAAIRNATVTTIAPTGTLSMIGGVSSGVEPVFAYAFIRNIMDNTRFVETNSVLREILEKRGIYSEEVMSKVAKEGTLAHIKEIPEDIRRVFVCAHDVSPIWHIKMQAAFQDYTDNAVSKTVNFPNDATKEDVAEVYQLAWKLGCKGTTIYRDGSRAEQVLSVGEVATEVVDGSQKKPETAEYGHIMPRSRPDITSGFTEKVKIGCGNLYITVNYDENGICEVFTNTGRAGGCPSQSEATARLVSVAMRSGIDPKKIVQQLKGIRCPSTIRQKGLGVTSCPDAIARALEKVLKAKDIGQQVNEEVNLPIEKLAPIGSETIITKHSKYCPECQSVLEHEGGCVTCRNCGYSKCG